MIRRILGLLLALWLLSGAACSGEAAGPEAPGTDEVGFEVTDADFPVPDQSIVFPPEEYEFTGRRVSVRYESETLNYTVESFTLDGIQCLLTKIWVRDPERQIRKVNAPWQKSLAKAADLMKQIPEAVLATNASGYITKQYPDIPESYPGVPEDYFFTTLGSLVITDGEVLRNLEGVPFYGLALSADGITLYRGEDNDTVLASHPVQTWAFFENCAMQADGEDLLPEEGAWPMAKELHPRTVLARVNRNNYLLFHVPNREDSYGMSLYRINLFFFRHFNTEWVYNLDGGYSTELVCRGQEKNARVKRMAPGRQKVADILCFTE